MTQPTPPQPNATEPKESNLPLMAVLGCIGCGVVVVVVAVIVLIVAMFGGCADDKYDSDMGPSMPYGVPTSVPADIVPPPADHPAPVSDEEFPGTVEAQPAQSVQPGAVMLNVDVALPEGMKLNPTGPTELIVRSEDEAILSVDGAAATRYAKPAFPKQVTLKTAEGETALLVDFDIYYCEAANEAKCYTRMVRLRVPLAVKAGAPDALTVRCTVPAKATLF